MAITEVCRPSERSQDKIIFSNQLCDEIRAILGKPFYLAKIRSRGPGSPTNNTLRDVWKCFEQHGVAAIKQPNVGRKKDLASRERIKAAMLEADLSTRQMAIEADVSAATYRRVMEEEKVVWYKPGLAQMLKEKDVQTRKDWSRKMIDMIHNQEFATLNTIWTDESWLFPGVHHNRHNSGYWRKKGQFHDRAEKLVQKSQSVPKIMAFCAIHPKFVFLDFISDFHLVESAPRHLIKAAEESRALANLMGQKGKTKEERTLAEWHTRKGKILTAEKYVAFLSHKVFPFIRSRLSEDEWKTCWWQQDGAPAHSAEQTIHFLQSVFGDRFLGYSARSKVHSQHIWPPHSPDLNPLDYWFWNQLKTLMSVRKPKNVSEIRSAALEMSTKFSPEDIKKAINDFPIRLRCLAAHSGAHFEYALDEFKRTSGFSAKCTACGDSHPCPCASCALACQADEIDRTARESELLDLAEEPETADAEIDAPQFAQLQPLVEDYCGFSQQDIDEDAMFWEEQAYSES